ncbi:DEAD/DEAH box helicase [uncultured Dokdonia sp.]|uniref:DEAD/DEAH box helicase n=1 Tax=uncultured Dokdonia sp. TaxID=575653 RepID=UPI0026397269|nr:DEAD/DEAH box helicase [uncultured Dokdonia sp.]
MDVINVSSMDDYVFDICHIINNLLLDSQEKAARDELIKLLDYHEINNIQYTPIVNHLIRKIGLYPYIDYKTAGWQERYVYEVFKVDTGEKEKLTLHREQSFLLKKLINGESIAVSAPTSFGKSFVIDSFISINNPKNVMIIVPTLALTDETRRRLYKKFANKYKIITTTDIDLAQKNIFIFPQERAINYVDKIEEIDLLIVDEFYKASVNFDKDRSPTLIKAILKLSKIAKQRYFLAPNISVLKDNPFTVGMEFLPLEFNTVFLEQHKLYLNIKDDEQLKNDTLLGIIKEKETKTLIYAGTYSNIDSISTLLLTNTSIKEKSLLEDFSNWLGVNYSLSWNLTNLVKRGTGIHNGRLHRSLSQIQVKLFEEKEEGLDNMVSTSSIIEGVNTSAENVVLWMNKNGTSNLNDFTYKNIIGRGGRMFKHFIGKIYILDAPPREEKTQLDLPFPEKILGDLDKENFKNELTKEQVAKIILYEEEMSEVLGSDVYERLKSENVFQSSDSDLIKRIAIDLSNNPKSWNGLSYLNSPNVNNWDRFLYKIIGFERSGWDDKYSNIVEFTKVLRVNWFRSIPNMLKRLEPFDIGLDDFFKLERKVSFKLGALLMDVNNLQKVILSDKNYDISRFVNHVSHAFLPKAVFQLEEFGLPRMISKKIHNSNVLKFYDENSSIELHTAIDKLNEIGAQKVKKECNLSGFENYIVDYFFEGIKTNT